MTRITIKLTNQEKDALRTLSEKQFRDPRAQAALIIRRELERLQLIEPMTPIQNDEQPAQGKPAAVITPITETEIQTA